MPDNLVIRLPKTTIDTQTEVEWGLFDEHCTVIELGQLSLSELATQFHEHAAELPVTLLTPGDSVFLTEVNIPTNLPGQLRKALPYMLEEQLAGDIEDTHIAMAPRRKGDAIRVAVVQHANLINWLDVLYELGFLPGWILPETLAAPPVTGGWRVLLDNSQCLVRTGFHRGMVLDADNIAAMLHLALQAEAARDGFPTLVISTASDGEPQASMVEDLNKLFAKGEHPEPERGDYRESIFEVLATTAIRERDDQINLLQGGYRQQRSRVGAITSGVQLGRVAAACLLALLCTWWGSGSWFHYQAARYEEQAASLYRSLYPDDRRVIDPKKQMEGKLFDSGASRGGHNFLVLLDRVSRPLTERRESGLVIQTLAWDQQGEKLTMDVRGAKLDDLETYRKRLAEHGLDAEITSAKQGADGFNGRLQVRRL
jgi:general secretion pathway protein L